MNLFLEDFSHLEPLWAAAAGKKGGTPPRGYGHATNGPAWRRGGSNHHHHPDQEPARAALAWRRRPAAWRRRHLARVQEVRGAQGAGWAEQSEATKNKDDIIMTGMTGNIFTRNFLLT